MSHDKFSNFNDSSNLREGFEVTFTCNSCGDSISAANDPASIERAQRKHTASASG
jgi:hypothetical protein